MMLTAAVVLCVLVALLRSLRSGFYAAHCMLVLGGSWLVRYYAGDAGMFSGRAVLCFLVLHLLSVNVMTFAAYAYDKNAARRQKWRVPERTLHALALIGGTPSALLAQKWLRHKTRKSSFRAYSWLIFMLQLALLAVFGMSH